MQIDPEIDASYMRMAVDLARKTPQEGGKITPKVAAVITDGRNVIGAAHRGQFDVRDHAEFTVLEKVLQEATLVRATAYVTLEPCTTRGKDKVPCVERLISRKVSRVVIGILDPNQSIRGRGLLALRRANIDVGLFRSDFAAELEEMNREFIRHQEEQEAMRHQTLKLYQRSEVIEYGKRLIESTKRKLVMFGNDLSWAKDYAKSIETIASAGKEVYVFHPRLATSVERSHELEAIRANHELLKTVGAKLISLDHDPKLRIMLIDPDDWHNRALFIVERRRKPGAQDLLPGIRGSELTHSYEAKVLFQANDALTMDAFIQGCRYLDMIK